MSRVIVALVVLAAAVSAGIPVRFGVSAGVSKSNIFQKSMTMIGFHDRISPQGGAFVELGDAILRAELLYSQRGVTEVTEIVNERGELIGTERYSGWADYVSLPILARANLNLPLGRLYLIAGPRADLFVGWTNETWLSLVLYDSQFARVGLGADIGVGVEFPIGRMAAMPELRYAAALTDAYRDGMIELYPHALQLSIGIRF